jgi:C4-dicarboxylate-specific signal transduction histidine kinase
LRQREPPVDEVIDIMNSIDSDAQRADKTIDAIRAFTRKQPSRRENVDLNEVIVDVLRLIASDAIRRGVSLRHELAPALPPVMGDPIQLQQVLVNLIVNAMDAQSDIRSLVGTLRSARAAATRRSRCRCAMAGCGIPPEKMSLLFRILLHRQATGDGLGIVDRAHLRGRTSRSASGWRTIRRAAQRFGSLCPPARLMRRRTQTSNGLCFRCAEPPIRP